MTSEQKEILLEKYTNNPKGWSKWLRASTNEKVLRSLVDAYPQLTSVAEMLYWLEHDMTDYNKCPTCGNAITKFECKHYPSHCSPVCTQLDPSVRDKHKSTRIER